jgi:hypothetical protein
MLPRYPDGIIDVERQRPGAAVRAFGKDSKGATAVAMVAGLFHRERPQSSSASRRIAGYIAWRQWRTTHDRLMLDLFDRCFATFQDLTRAVLDAFHKVNPDVADLANV